jgi:hypothetical protein
MDRNATLDLTTVRLLNKFGTRRTDGAEVRANGELIGYVRLVGDVVHGQFEAVNLAYTVVSAPVHGRFDAARQLLASVCAA